jgi:hypothetical protein
VTIFTHTDSDGDELEVLVDEGDPDESLILWATPRYSRNSPQVGVRLSHDRVSALRDALTDWLNEATEPTSAPVTPEMVRAMIAEAVMPFRRSPQTYVPEPDAEAGWTSSGLKFCERYNCRQFNLKPHLEHGDPVVPPVENCADCGHARNDHGDGFCWGGTSVIDHATCACALFALSPPPKPVALPYCTINSGGCGHSWGQHTGGKCKARQMTGLKINECGCTRVRSAQPGACTCPVGPRIRSYPHSHIAGCPRSSSGAQ